MEVTETYNANCDAVLADMLMLGAVQKDTKVWTRAGVIQLSAAGGLSGFARWYGGEGRGGNVDALKQRVADAFAVVDACVEAEERARALRAPPDRAEYESILRNRQRLVVFRHALAAAAAGIATLGKTYGEDSRVSVVLAIEARNVLLGLERAEAAIARLPPASVDIGADMAPLVASPPRHSSSGAAARGP